MELKHRINIKSSKSLAHYSADSQPYTMVPSCYKLQLVNSNDQVIPWIFYWNFVWVLCRTVPKFLQSTFCFGPLSRKKMCILFKCRFAELDDIFSFGICLCLTYGCTWWQQVFQFFQMKTLAQSMTLPSPCLNAEMVLCHFGHLVCTKLNAFLSGQLIRPYSSFAKSFQVLYQGSKAIYQHDLMLAFLRSGFLLAAFQKRPTPLSALEFVEVWTASAISAKSSATLSTF